jgi:hypothetical protein
MRLLFLDCFAWAGGAAAYCRRWIDYFAVSPVAVLSWRE